jgi:hypothetical protein
MGLTSSNLSNNDLDYLSNIKTQCQENRNNMKFLVNLLKTEWSNVVKKWNIGKLSRNDINITTLIIGFINDDDLNPIYTRLITKLNNGVSTSSDYDDVTTYIEKM